jgi:uncharacterized membrane protein YkvA (DUF1232 family)
MAIQQELEQVVERWLPSLQQDLKDFLHVVGDDPDLDEPLREMAVSAILYTLAPGDVIPDTSGAVGYLDDALALRVVLDAIRAKSEARFESYHDRIPDLAASAGEDLDVFREALGDELYEAFVARVGSDKNEFKGKRARELITSDDGPAWLDEEVSLAALKLDFKPAAVQAAARKAATVPQMFRQKLQPTRR